VSVEAVGDRVSFAKHILEAHRSLLASGSLAYSANTRLQNIRTRFQNRSVSKGPKGRISVTISEPAD